MISIYICFVCYKAEKGGGVLNEIILSIGSVWEQYIWGPIANYNFLWDTLDILCLTAVLYGVFLFLKGRRAVKLAWGLALIAVAYAVSDIAGLRAIHQLLAGIAPFTIILLAIIFQSEIREALERLGSQPFGLLSGGRDNRADLAHTVSEAVAAACQIALSDKEGALIVIERSTPLGDFADKGHHLDATVTEDLLRNIFVDRSPLHDGAVIIRNNRITAAGCKLPLSSNEDVLKNLGTRHRASVGITEVSDCVVLVVSEETHMISVANNGLLKRDYFHDVSELQNETTLKAVQSKLRNDLFLILAGTSYEEEDRVHERKRIKFHFTWRLKDNVRSEKAGKENRTRYKLHKSNQDTNISLGKSFAATAGKADLDTDTPDDEGEA